MYIEIIENDNIVIVEDINQTEVTVSNDLVTIIEVVEKGDKGEQGPQGPTGSVVSYIHNQSSPNTTWVINHNLGFKPNVQVFNSGSMEIGCDIVHTSNNQTQILLVAPISGYARLI